MILIEIHGQNTDTAKAIKERLRQLLADTPYYSDIVIEIYPTEVKNFLDIAYPYFCLKIPSTDMLIKNMDISELRKILDCFGDKNMNTRFVVEQGYIPSCR